MKNLFRILSAVLALALLTVGCAFAEAPTEDRAGNAITVPAELNKVISLAPSTSQVLEALGLLDRLVAVDTYTPQYIPSTSELPSETPNATSTSWLERCFYEHRPSDCTV